MGCRIHHLRPQGKDREARSVLSNGEAEFVIVSLLNGGLKVGGGGSMLLESVPRLAGGYRVSLHFPHALSVYML